MSLGEQSILDSLLEEKSVKTGQLNRTLYELTSLQKKYDKQANELWVKTNFNEVIEDSKPTVDMKKAYIKYALADLVEQISMEKTNKEVLENELIVIDAKIKAEMKYLELACKINLEEC